MISAILKRNEQYEAQVERLLADMSKVSEERLNRKPGPGAWSALQTMEHLILAEEGSFLYVQKKMNAPAKNIPQAGLGAAWRSFLVRFYLSTPIKFKAPKGVGTEQLAEQSSLNALWERWLAVRAQWRNFFETLPSGYASKTVYKHPLGGRLSWVGMIGFFEAHLKRHRKQIERAIG